MGRFSRLFKKAMSRLYYDAYFAWKKLGSGMVSIHPKELQHPVYLRKDTSDIATFYQLFYVKQYDIDYKIKPKTIIDCGANIGLSTVYLKNLFPEATIIAVEPERSNFSMLEKNTAGYDNIHCLNNGIWNTDTNLEITNIDTAQSWGFMTEERSTPNERTIPAISIDSIVEKYGLDTIDILKIDIEGSEKELFEKNTEQWLPKVKVLIIEIHDYMRPGCARSIFRAISPYNFSMHQGDESLIFYFTGSK